MTTSCAHSAEERATACAEGACPLCLKVERDTLDANLRKWWTEGERREQQKRMAVESALTECVMAMKRVHNGKLMESAQRRWREALEQAERVLAARKR